MRTAKFIAAATVLALAAMARAEDNSLLYWMVENPVYSYNNESVDFKYAKIQAIDNDGANGASYLYVYNQQGSTGYDRAYDIPGDNGYSTGGIYSGLFDGTKVDTFLIELYSATNDKVGWQSVSYAQAFNNGSIATTMQTGGATVLAVGQVVPEPTSGLMLLIGLAGLALRRRRI